MSNGVVLIKLGVIRWTESLHFLEALFSSVKCWVPCLTENILNWKEPTTVTKHHFKWISLLTLLELNCCLHTTFHMFYDFHTGMCDIPYLHNTEIRKTNVSKSSWNINVMKYKQNARSIRVFPCMVFKLLRTTNTVNCDNNKYNLLYFIRSLVFLPITALT